MLRAAIVFFVIALLAIIFGATGFAGVSMEIGKLLLGQNLGRATQVSP